MKNIFASLLFFGFVVVSMAQENADTFTMGFEEYNPTSTLVVPENPVTRAKYPFVDVHSHHWRGRDKAYFDNLGKEMDELNMKALINLSGGTGERLQGNVDSSKAYLPGRFVVFANIELRSINDPDWAENTVKQLENDYKNGARGLKIYKSQGMSNKDSLGNRIKINDPRIDPVWAKCGELGIPILIHSADPASFGIKEIRQTSVG